MEGLLTMSQKESDRLSLIKQLIDKKISARESSEILHLSERQIFRLLSRVRSEGSKGIISAVGKLTKRAHFQFELVRINFVVIRFFVEK